MYLDQDMFTQTFIFNFKQNKAIYKYIRVNNEENIKYLNYLLSGGNWENVLSTA
jgi:hypothetical protein